MRILTLFIFTGLFLRNIYSYLMKSPSFYFTSSQSIFRSIRFASVTKLNFKSSKKILFDSRRFSTIKIGYLAETSDGLKGTITSFKNGWVTLDIITNTGEIKVKKTRPSNIIISENQESEIVAPLRKDTPKNSEVKKLSSSEFILEELDPPTIHKMTKKWIIFSDLHVKLSSIETCEEVLDLVSQEAVKREAGIIFLGDFWHVRGALNVELLNRIMRSLNKWTSPVIMIPGNHDQVTLGGTIHSLEPLQYSFSNDKLLLISSPCVCLGAVWIPYRRDALLMQAILEASMKRNDLNIIFCHADVKGAYMNDGMKSREGISIDCFPHDKAIYSGHFHKPHTMGNSKQTMLRYVGSPYQTSLSEAGQEKYLYCLSNEKNETYAFNWKEIERWPVKLGKSYYKANSIEDKVTITSAVKGDRLVVKVKRNENYEPLINSLRSKGVEVEIRIDNRTPLLNSKTEKDATGSKNTSEIITQSTNVIENGSPSTILENFMDLDSIQKSIMQTYNTSSNNSANLQDTNLQNVISKIKHEGKKIVDNMLYSLSNNSTSGSSAGGVPSKFTAGNKIRELKLENLKLKNFGPYGSDEITYPLSSRGLVLLRGQSSDGTGADSNGAGKTTLAMSIMWALTGSLDSRLINDGRAIDVAYDSLCSNSAASSSAAGSTAASSEPLSNLNESAEKKRTAEVYLEGTINFQPFTITRKRNYKKSELYFTLDNKDLSQQSVKDTQALIDDVLGVGSGILQRCCFYGQHSHTLQSLLGLTDIKLKSEMSALVDLDIWTSSLQEVKLKIRDTKGRNTEISVEEKIRQDELDRTKNNLDEHMRLHRQIENELKSSRESLNKEISESNMIKYENFGAATSESLLNSIDNCKLDLANHKLCNVTMLETRLEQVTDRKKQTISEFEIPLGDLIGKINNHEKQMVSLNNSLKNSQAQENSFSQQIDKFTTQLNTTFNDIRRVAPQESFTTFNMKVNSATKMLTTTLEKTRIYKSNYDESIQKVAYINTVINTLNASLNSLNSLLSLKSPTDNQKIHHVKSADHNEETCPTCNQPFQESSRSARKDEIEIKLKELNSELISLNKIKNSSKILFENFSSVNLLLNQIDEMNNNLNKKKKESTSFKDSVQKMDVELIKLNSEYNLKVLDKNKLLIDLDEQEKNTKESLKSAKVKEIELSDKIEDLRSQYDKLIDYEKTNGSTHVEANQKVIELENKLKSSQLYLSKQSNLLFAIENKLKELKDEKQTLFENSILYDQLAFIFGPRGIQHFILTETLRQLETISNSYLEVLAEGGIQLSLQSDLEADKIVKSVMIRASDGNYRERALSQLSGGQWRRVSMALDFAFAEIIRRKGTLRCNLIVMDEILTHLDASGREAVGSLLRAMVSGYKTPNSITDNVSPGSEPESESESNNEKMEYASWAKALLGSGAYETVIVILQDLAATELEEAFDHIDVVVKENDSSRVIIDGS